MTKGSIGLITVLYKSDELLSDFLKSIHIQKDVHYHLYLVDNSWNEASEALLKKLLHQYQIYAYTYLPQKKNLGVAVANNIGLEMALAKAHTHILLLNNDIQFENPNLLKGLLQIAMEDTKPIVVPKILYYDQQTIWMGGGYMNKWKALGVHKGLGKKNGWSASQVPAYISYAPTTFMLLHREVFEKIGLLDECFFAYYEDTDFVYRAVQKGIKPYYEPRFSILHRVSYTSGGAKSEVYIYLSHQSKIYFIYKHFKGLHRLFCLCYTLFTRMIWYVRFDTIQRKALIKGLKEGFALGRNIKRI